MMNSIFERKDSVLFFIGENGAGKTYRFNQFQKKEEFYTLLINEEGIAKSSVYQPRVTVSEGKYIYSNEADRGIGQTSSKVEEIQDNVIGIIEFCKDKIYQLNKFINKSKGQEKLYSLLNVFLTHSLNNLEFVLLDEPENYLDENLIKVMCDLFNRLISINIRVRISTHNAKLLTLMNVELANIILVTRNKEYCIMNEELNIYCRQVADEVEVIRISNKCKSDRGINWKLNIYKYGDFYKHFLQQDVYCDQFYSCLFYENVVLVEGNSDYRSLIKLGHNQAKSISYFSCNGKAYMPFYYKLFKCYNKRVRVIIDSDYQQEPRGTDQKHAYAITKWFENIKDNYMDLIIHNPDFEGHYGIDIDKHKKECELPSTVPHSLLKVSAAMKFFSDDVNKKTMIEMIFKHKSDYEFE